MLWAARLTGHQLMSDFLCVSNIFIDHSRLGSSRICWSHTSVDELMLLYLTKKKVCESIYGKLSVLHYFTQSVNIKSNGIKKQSFTNTLSFEHSVFLGGGGHGFPDVHLEGSGNPGPLDP